MTPDENAMEPPAHGEKRGLDEDEPEGGDRGASRRRTMVYGLELNEEEDECYAQYFDEKTGMDLPAKMVEEAATEEVSFMHGIGLYDYAPLAECYANTGKGSVSTKWVRTNKGTEVEPEVRCRLVARDFKPKGEKDREDLFAAMLPLEAKKILFRQAVRQKRVWRNCGWQKLKLRFIDVKKAHLNGIVDDVEFVHVELPPEDSKPGMCARLNRWLDGMRPAASAWEKDYQV